MPRSLLLFCLVALGCAEDKTPDPAAPAAGALPELRYFVIGDT